MKKLLITGGTGFVGLNLVRKLNNQGYEIHVIVRESSNLMELKALEENIYIHTYDQSIQGMIEIFKIASLISLYV
ncbi:GDP-mannose 4,6-dehydratase [Acetobacterium sp. K1/6]|uniref:GDP-mannose 4,6-dehydratase n=1 Tax=Acetobacterium sp. K1/6 TaxID=3055467 RepID=UPI002ACA246E|nr:GDP-mannose 4,6-dehydratase [Acetobacterium sp. K1/6]MDZ5724903.1 GDP-mannose 4,6-dehydratase [Acetobacterium sp. K1/6]